MEVVGCKVNCHRPPDTMHQCQPQQRAVISSQSYTMVDTQPMDTMGSNSLWDWGAEPVESMYTRYKTAHLTLVLERLFALGVKEWQHASCNLLVRHHLFKITHWSETTVETIGTREVLASTGNQNKKNPVPTLSQPVQSTLPRPNHVPRFPPLPPPPPPHKKNAQISSLLLFVSSVRLQQLPTLFLACSLHLLTNPTKSKMLKQDFWTRQRSPTVSLFCFINPALATSGTVHSIQNLNHLFQHPPHLSVYL